MRDIAVPGSGLRVLVVEDEIFIALDIEQTLEALGCTVLGAAPSVAQALAIIDRQTPDFAILDVNLGRERSTAIAEELKARGVPFGLSTSYSVQQLPEEVFRDAPFLGKPLKHDVLIDNLVRVKQAQGR